MEVAEKFLNGFKKLTNSIVPKLREKTRFGPIKSLFSFSTAKTGKSSWKKLGKTKLVVKYFDEVTNKIKGNPRKLT